MVDGQDWLLSDDEFDALTDEEQNRYLDLLAVHLDAWSLSPKQKAADRLADSVHELLYGGAAGGGKSEWMLHRAHRLSRAIPGHATLLLRTVFPELRRSLIRRSLILFAATPPEERPVWRAADKEWRYPNGSVIEFGYCETDDDVAQFLSAEYDMIGFDELTEFSLYQYTMIRSRARTTRAKLKLGARPHVIAATNPGRRGHAWVKKLFVVGTDYGDNVPVWVREPEAGEFQFSTDDKESVAREQGWRRIGFMPATVLDNPHIDPAYVAHLMSLPGTLKRQYLEGDWDVFEGQYFPEFQRTITLTHPERTLEGVTTPEWNETVPLHVVEPFEIPHSWPRVRGIDWGFAAPFACLWAAFDENGECYIYREFYATQLTPGQQAEQVKALSVCTAEGLTKKEKIDYTMADPASWSQRGAGQSIAQQWAAAGLHCRRADNDRVAGWNRVREYLRPVIRFNDQTWRMEVDVGLRIFSTCTDTLRTLPEMIHDKNNPEDADTTGEDHLPDALRYLLMSRPRKYRPGRKRPDMATMQGRVAAQMERFDRLGRRRDRSRRGMTEIGRY